MGQLASRCGRYLLSYVVPAAAFGAPVVVRRTHQGMRLRQQDRVICRRLEKSGGTGGRAAEHLHLYAVLDGHGPDERVVEEATRQVVQRLHGALEESAAVSDLLRSATLQRVIRECDEGIRHMCGVSADEAGTTLTAALWWPAAAALTLVNLGDSRTVVLRRPVGGAWEEYASTEDHKPALDRERWRIQAGSGKVIPSAFQGTRRIYRVVPPPGESKNALSVSRALGDHAFKRRVPPLVSPEPDVQTIFLRAGWEHLILLASDGLWDDVSCKWVVDLLQAVLPATLTGTGTGTSTAARLGRAVDRLGEEALAYAHRDVHTAEERYAVPRDNRTILAVLLPVG